MTERGHKLVVFAETVLLLVPVTLVVAFLLVLGYPAYPPVAITPLQLVFDLCLLLVVFAIAAGWWLAGRFFLEGAGALTRASRATMTILLTGALIGTVGAAIALEHMLNPRTAAEHVGFALLAPGAGLVPIAVHLVVHRGWTRGGRSRVRGERHPPRRAALARNRSHER